MKTDFHIHVKLSKKVEFSEEYFNDMIDGAKKEGLNAITLTEHFNTRNFFDIYSYMDKTYPYVDDYYDINGFRLFPGMEVDVKEGGHILVIGNRANIISLREQLIGHEKEDDFIPFQELIELCHPMEILLIGAHPLRKSNPLIQIPDNVLKQLDCFDLNAKDLNRIGVEEMSTQVKELADRVGIPVVGGSDSHYPLQVGSIVNVFQEDCSTIGQLKSSIQNGHLHFTISPCIETKVQAAEEIKSLLVSNLVTQGK